MVDILSVPNSLVEMRVVAGVFPKNGKNYISWLTPGRSSDRVVLYCQSGKHLSWVRDKPIATFLSGFYKELSKNVVLTSNPDKHLHFEQSLFLDPKLCLLSLFCPKLHS